VILIGLAVKMIEDQHQAIVYLWEEICDMEKQETNFCL
jgi:hypothetical protein